VSSSRSVDLRAVLYGHDPLPRIVAVEPLGGTGVTLYRRLEDGGVVSERDTLRPWLLVRAADLGALPPSPKGEREVVDLAGTSDLNRLVFFSRWQEVNAAQAALQAVQVPFFWFRSPVAQYLALTGHTLFHGMRFEDLYRLQIDVETASLRAHSPDAAVLLVALTDSRGYEQVFSARDGGEAELLRRVSTEIAARDPDVIEGHNLADFDLPYIAARADALGVPLAWGRDGQRLWLQEREGRLKVGGRILPSTRVRIHGRHVLDTYQQIQRFDSGGNLESYALKAVMEELDLVREEREFVDRTEINALWARDPERLARYCLDDARDVRELSELITPTEFYQTQIVPRLYQDVATGGTGEKVNALMVRAYVAARAAVPVPEEPRPYPGGYLELRRAGVFRRVVKCDVESLYPAVMLHYGYKPRTDVLGVFLPMLRDLTERRLEAKRKIRTSDGSERSYWTGLSSSYKVLINSYYGYLGYQRANFNDFDAAEQVTTTGQMLIKEVLAALEARGCEVIEVDTDGVYFVAPPGVDAEAQETALIDEVGGVLPATIRLAHDGRYAGMIALKQKTYFLLTYDGRLIAKGSSLRSRRDERFLREFGQQAAITLIRGSLDDVSARYRALAERIQHGELPVDEFARRESITGKTYSSPGLKRLAAAAKGTAVGQKVEVYQRRGGSLAQVAEYAGDEDRDYLLRRLHDMARRYEVLAPSKDEFRRLFPKLTDGPVQLSLFD
jgi:DNA polymerase elongation subunit (family B)